MSPRSRFFMTVVILIGVLVASLTCEVPTPIPTPTHTATATVTPTMTVTFPTITPTPTLAPTSTLTPTPIPTTVVTTTIAIGWQDEYVVVLTEDPDAWRLWVDLELQAADGRRLDGRTVASDCRPSVDKPGVGRCDEIKASWVIPQMEAGGCRLWLCLRWTDEVEEVVRCHFKDAE